MSACDEAAIGLAVHYVRHVYDSGEVDCVPALVLRPADARGIMDLLAFDGEYGEPSLHCGVPYSRESADGTWHRRGEGRMPDDLPIAAEREGGAG